MAPKTRSKLAKASKENLSIVVKKSPKKNKTLKTSKKSILRVLEDNSSPKNKEDRLAVYDFTYDPNEEPPPQKKKKKRTARKKAPPKPKIFVFKNNYNKNISKALESLKSVVAQKNIVPVPDSTKQGNNKKNENSDTLNCSVQNAQNITRHTDEQSTEEDNRQMNPVVEDDYLNSPLPSPVRNETFKVPDTANHGITSAKTQNCDPLNLQENLSFFDDEPVACSSLNVSRKQPLASPWRADFETLPIKWDINLSVKPNLTPAYETSFVNFDNTKKHIYTNMVSVNNTTQPDIGETSNNGNWKQTSILSFIKEVVDKKQKNKNYLTPPKANSTPHKSPGGHAVASPIVNVTEMATPLKRNEEVLTETPSKVKKAADVLATIENCFGFDNSEHNDQENIVPKRNFNKKRIRELRPRAAAVLREINNMPIKVTNKKPSKEQIKGLKSKATILSENNNQRKIIPETVTRVLRSRNTHKLSNNNDQDVGNPKYDKENSNDCPQTENVTSNDDPEWVGSVTEKNEGTQDSEPIALFEDIPVIHHSKPVRKSYGKVKKVAFRRHSDLITDVNYSDDEAIDDDDNDMNDESFKVTVLKTRKTAKKKPKVQKRSKKEEEEAEAWAAGFNSMCEDVEGFELVIG